MIALDVNVLVSAFHTGAPDHSAMRAWLEGAVSGGEPVGVSDAVLVGTVRVLTHPRVFDPPASLEAALSVVSALLQHPSVTVLGLRPGYWDVVAAQARAGSAHGNLVADAAHAAVAIQHGATFVTKDRDFARFPDLHWRQPGLPGQDL